MSTLNVSDGYFSGNFGYDAPPPMPVSFEKTDPVNIYSETNGFKFKYVPEEEFARVIKRVRRNKQKEQEEKEWLQFLASQKKTCLCSMCPEGHNYFKETQDDIPENPKQQNHYKEKAKQHRHVEQETNDHSSHEDISESELERRRKVCSELSAALKEDIQKPSVSPTVSQTQMNECIHAQRSKCNFSDASQSNAALNTIAEEALSSCASQYSMLSDAECLFKARSGSSRENLQNHQCASGNTQSPRSARGDTLQQPIVPKLCLFKARSGSSKENLQNHQCASGNTQSPRSARGDALQQPPIVPKLNLGGILQSDSIHFRRIGNLRKKIDAAFDDIIDQYKKLPEPDGSQDLMRRRKRASEFSARFARNYLYNLRRQVCDVRMQVKDSCSTYRGRHTLHQAICQKLISGHQTTLQALQAYVRHMPTSIKGAASSKLKELFESFTELSDLCNKLGIDSPETAEVGTESIDLKSRAVLELIEGKSEIRDMEDDLCSPHESEVNVMTTTGRREWESCLREPEKTKASGSTARGSVNSNPRWKEMATKLARAAYGSPYKKRSFAAYRHHKRPNAAKKSSRISCVATKPEQETMDDLVPAPPNPPPPSPKSLSKLHLMEERKVGDNIKTAIEFVPSECSLQAEELPPEKSGSALKMPFEAISEEDMRSLSTKLVEACEVNVRLMVSSIAKKFEDQVGGGSQATGQNSAAEELKTVLQQIQSMASESLQQIESNSNVSLPTRQTSHEKNKHKSSAVGTKNVQIIYLPPHEENGHNKDEENGHSKVEEKENASKSNEEVERRAATEKDNTSCYGNRLVPNLITTEQSKTENIHYKGTESECTLRPPKSLPDNALGQHVTSKRPTTLSISKNVMWSALDYRQRFLTSAKTNPVCKEPGYLASIVRRLADQLVEETLEETIRETEVDSLIKEFCILELEGKCEP